MPKIERPLTQQEIDDFETEGAMIRGAIERAEREEINISQMVEQAISVLGFEVGIEFAHGRREVASFPEDQEDWAEVVRVIKERQAQMVTKE
jgi:hypothetical protein